MSGAALFARFALPPNAYGYCGPADVSLVSELTAAGDSALEDLRAIAQQFDGAWPYLQFIGGSSGQDPLASEVVEAYWLGNNLLRDIDTLAWGNSVDDRFRPRVGSRWQVLADGIIGSVPNHAFHVFCVYPWVGLLRSGFADQALDVIDQCRIRWGTVVEAIGDDVLVMSRPLEWNGRELVQGIERVERVRASVAEDDALETGDIVALHWDYVCQPLSQRQLSHLKRYHDRHLAIANDSGDSLAALIER
ncbi:MAG: DUF6390 family protein [Actinomycetota bacterium]